MSPTIRPATLADVDAMFRIRLSVDENTLSAAELAALGITPASIAERVAAAPCAWVAVDDGQIDEARPVVGFAMVELDEACLFAAFVAPAQQGRGLGVQLIQACEAALFARHDRAWLETAGDSRAARLHARLGWVRVAELGDGGIRMEKPRPARA